MDLRDTRRVWVAALLALALLPSLVRAAETPVNLGDAAPRRFAIVIGNSDYEVAPDLRNAGADARLVADFLAEQDYAVTQYADLDKAGFEAMLQRVLFEIDKDSEVVFYFAGHGVQVAGANYLIPTDAAFDDPYDLPFEAVSLTTIVNVLGARARTQIVILDSCRANPFAGALVLADITRATSETQEGFNVLTAPVNSLLAFSTSPGANAWDGSDDHSPFTGALIEAARKAPERPIGEILEGVRRQVYEQTSGLQVPWESSTLVQSVAFGVPSAGFVLTTGDAPEAGRRRSWMSPTMPQASVVNTSAESASGAIEMTAPLDHEVRVGPMLVAELALPPDTPVTITELPTRGRLLVDLDDGRRVDAGSQSGLTAASLQTLAYEPEPGGGPALPEGAKAGQDSFTIAAAAGGTPSAVGLTLEPDPCDIAAADRLDPEGVGAGLFPNEIVPETALAACQASVERSPDVGRFHYQLGRVQLAARDFDGARGSFERARDLGHTRAWVALGSLVATEDARSGGLDGGPVPAEALEFYKKGVEAGDPYAFHALGRELLRRGPDEATRRRGFQLLQQALEFGHTFSMNELGAYYMNPELAGRRPAAGPQVYRGVGGARRHLRLLQPRHRLSRRARGSDRRYRRSGGVVREGRRGRPSRRPGYARPALEQRRARRGEPRPSRHRLVRPGPRPLRRVERRQRRVDHPQPRAGRLRAARRGGARRQGGGAERQGLGRRGPGAPQLARPRGDRRRIADTHQRARRQRGGRRRLRTGERNRNGRGPGGRRRLRPDGHAHRAPPRPRASLLADAPLPGRSLLRRDQLPPVAISANCRQRVPSTCVWMVLRASASSSRDCR